MVSPTAAGLRFSLGEETDTKGKASEVEERGPSTPRQRGQHPAPGFSLSQDLPPVA